ncbi:DNA-processing protein DprA [Spirulina sp. CS-785/01]|uniref:DNA-processing protein DprA n=1 Tax=Spirulina sp. CS-785/01 TaxID=3021716 RepID=UPI00232DBB70|nr:DNA-processing protein DprA [Spirulina sp. CS-785/01]MDB9311505.1 DNA-processing protein DprA [Spirulina sp. CS-785/01]
MSQERVYWLAWSNVAGVGAVSIQRLRQHFGSLQTAWTAPKGELLQVEGFGAKGVGRVVDARSQVNPQQLLETTAKQGFNFWTPDDPDYPRLLLEIPSLPPVLYHKGQVNLLENQGQTPLIGIVGTRNASEYGRRWTGKISKTLAQHGFTIVSGLAAGIDTQAHLSCLETGGRTIAVLGTGIDRIYPRSNTKLYHRIAQEGLILSDYPPGTPPEGRNFPPRNRIIAGLSRAVLVMEAARRSGALITARYATEFNRDIYILPGSLDNPQALGCLELIQRGAQLILGEKELLEQLGEIPKLDQLDTAAPELPPDLEPELVQVLKTIPVTPIPFDKIVQDSQLEAGMVSGFLVQLELLGLVTQLPGMQYQRIS